MKIIVDTPEDYKKWLASKPSFAEELKASKTAASPTDASTKSADSAKINDTKMVAPMAMK